MKSHPNFHDQEFQDQAFQFLDCVYKNDFKRLKNDFDRSPQFGRSPEWKDATISDAVLLICTFVNELPDPIIPFKHQQSMGRDKAMVSCLQKLSLHSFYILQFCLHLVDYLRIYCSRSTYIWVLEALISAVLLQSIDKEPRHKEIQNSRADVFDILMQSFGNSSLRLYKGSETDYPDNFVSTLLRRATYI